VYLDGVVLKRSWAGEVRNISVLVAIGVGTDGFRQILGVAEGEKEDEPWGCPSEGYGEDQGGDDLLEEAAHLLDHGETVGCLDSGTLEPIVEDRVFIHGQIEGCRFAHDFDADVMGIAVGKQVVEVIDRARKNAGKYREPHFRANEPPEVLRQRIVEADLIDSIDDEAAHDANADRQKGDDDADGEIPGNDGRARLPDEVENRGNVFERAQAVSPGIARGLRWIGLSLAGLAGEIRVLRTRGHASLHGMAGERKA